MYISIKMTFDMEWQNSVYINNNIVKPLWPKLHPTFERNEEAVRMADHNLFQCTLSWSDEVVVLYKSFDVKHNA